MKDTTAETSLSVSCVTFDSDVTLLKSTIESLVTACETSIGKKNLAFVDLYLIDNGSTQKNLDALLDIQKKYLLSFRNIKIFSGHGNIGYGRGNNLAINESNCGYHLILNPDVLTSAENINIGINYLVQHPDVGMVAPSAVGTDERVHYIAKRHPSVAILLTRALKFKFLERLLKKQLDAYEYRDKIPSTTPLAIELASGCYMLCRTATLKTIGGFDPRFFMYFEDFDLCIRLRKESKIMHLPNMHIVHTGGNASRKGWRHIGFLSVSLVKFLLKNQ